ncbi:MAG: type II toxin-antitoxin system RelE/ParE family toxin [Acidobacteria bacterium]|nr:type II toxin-antitoxin system RelE/ParE family toxin [Acidobacteriota bacterium]
MAFRVELAPQAVDDLDEITAYIAGQSSFAVAERWFNSIIKSISALSRMASRCPLAPESAELGQEVRVLLHGRKGRTYKIFYGVQHESRTSGIVRVFHVRHWARKPLPGEELELLLGGGPA